MNHFEQIQQVKQHYGINFQEPKDTKGYLSTFVVSFTYGHIICCISNGFPYTPPSFFIRPIHVGQYVNEKGEIRVDLIHSWSYKSNILKVMIEVDSLLKIIYTKESNPIINPPIDSEHKKKVSDNKVNSPQKNPSSLNIIHDHEIQLNPLSIQINQNEFKELLSEENIKASLERELHNKSIEELILIYNNQDEFVNKLTDNIKKENITMISDVMKMQGKIT